MSQTITMILLFSMVGVPIFGIGGWALYRAYLKRVAVKCVFMTPERKVFVKILKVKDGIVTNSGKSYDLDSDLFVIGKGNWVTYYFNESDAKPLNLLGFESSDVASRDLDSRINSTIMRDLIGSFQKKMDPTTVAIVFGLITVGLIGIVAYLGAEKINELSNAIEEIRDLLRLLGGM